MWTEKPPEPPCPGKRPSNCLSNIRRAVLRAGAAQPGSRQHMRVRSTTDRPKGRPTRLTGIKSVFSCDFGLLYYLTSNIPGYCPRSKEFPVNFMTKPQNNAAPPHKSSARTLPGCKSPPFQPGAQTGFRSWPARNANSLNGPTHHSPPPAQTISQGYSNQNSMVLVPK